MGVAIYLLAIAIMLIGVYAVVAKKNIVKIIVGLLIVHYAVNLLLVLIGFRAVGDAPGAPPILAPDQSSAELAQHAVDPLPQAMVLTSIVIGLGVTALMVALALRLYEKYGSFDMQSMRELKG